MAWGKHFYTCEECGTTEHKYWAKGLCSSCYRKKRYRENDIVRELGKISTEIWRSEHRERNLRLMRLYAQNKRERLAKISA